MPSIDTNWSCRLASTLLMPLSWWRAPETSLTQLSHVMGTAKTVCFMFRPISHMVSEGVDHSEQESCIHVLCT